MAAEQEPQMEIGHVLFIDLVGYSKLSDRRAEGTARQLTENRAGTAQVREATERTTR